MGDDNNSSSSFELSLLDVVNAVPALLPAIAHCDPTALANIERTSRSLREAIFRQRAWPVAIYGPGWAEKAEQAVPLREKRRRQRLQAKKGAMKAPAAKPFDDGGLAELLNPLPSLPKEDEECKELLILDRMGTTFAQTAELRAKQIDELRTLLDRSNRTATGDAPAPEPTAEAAAAEDADSASSNGKALADDSDDGEGSDGAESAAGSTKKKQKKESGPNKKKGANDSADEASEDSTFSVSEDEQEEDEAKKGADDEEDSLAAVAAAAAADAADSDEASSSKKKDKNKKKRKLARPRVPHTPGEIARIREIIAQGLVSFDDYAAGSDNIFNQWGGNGSVQPRAAAATQKRARYHSASSAAFRFGSLELAKFIREQTQGDALEVLSPSRAAVSFVATSAFTVFDYAKDLARALDCVPDPRSIVAVDEDNNSSVEAKRAVEVLAEALNHPEAPGLLVQIMLAALARRYPGAVQFLLFGEVSLPEPLAEFLLDYSIPFPLPWLQPASSPKLVSVRVWTIVETLERARMDETALATTFKNPYMATFQQMSEGLYYRTLLRGSLFQNNLQPGFRQTTQVVRQRFRPFSDRDNACILDMMDLLVSKPVRMSAYEFELLLSDKRIPSALISFLNPFALGFGQSMHVKADDFPASDSWQRFVENNVARSVLSNQRFGNQNIMNNANIALAPSLLDRCVATGRAEFIPRLVELGFDVNNGRQYNSCTEDVLKTMFSVSSLFEDDEDEPGDEDEEVTLRAPKTRQALPIPINIPRPLEVALWNLDVDSVSALLEAGADVNSNFSLNPAICPNELSPFPDYDQIKRPKGVTALLAYISSALDWYEETSKPASEKKSSTPSKPFRNSFGVVAHRNMDFFLAHDVMELNPNQFSWSNNAGTTRQEVIPDIVELREKFALCSKIVSSAVAQRTGSPQSLIAACDNGDLELVRQLLADSTTVRFVLEQRDSVSDTPLHVAARAGRADLCSVLLESAKSSQCLDSVLHAKNWAGLTPLTYSCWNPMSRSFALTEVELNQYLNVAFRMANVTRPQQLGLFGLMQNQDEKKPVSYSGRNPCLDVTLLLPVVEALLEHETAISVHCDRAGTSVLTHAVIATFSWRWFTTKNGAKFDNLIIRRLVATELSRMSGSSSLCTPIMEAVRANDADTLKLLLAAGADPFQIPPNRDSLVRADFDVVSPLLLAARRLPATLSVLKVLLEVHEAQQNDSHAQQVLEFEDFTGRTALQYTIRFAGSPSPVNNHFAAMSKAALAENNEEDDDDIAVVTQPQAVDLVRRFIGGCGASAEALFPPAVFSLHLPQEVIQSIMTSPGFDSKSVIKPSLSSLLPGKFYRKRSPFGLLLQALLEALTQARNQAQQNQQRGFGGGFGGGGGGSASFRVNFETDWFGTTSSFKSFAEAETSISEGWCKFLFGLLDAYSVSFKRLSNGEFEDLPQSLLYAAAGMSSVPFVKKLFEKVKEANPDAPDSAYFFVNKINRDTGVSALHHVSDAGVCRELLAQGAQVIECYGIPPSPFIAPPAANVYGFMAFGANDSNSQDTATNALVEAGDVAYVEGRRRSAFTSFVQDRNSLKGFMKLVHAGAHPREGPRRVDDKGNTLLHLLCSSPMLSQDHVDTLQFLLFDCEPRSRLSPNLQNFAGLAPDALISMNGQSNPDVANQITRMIKRARANFNRQLGRGQEMERQELFEFLGLSLAEDIGRFERQDAVTFGVPNSMFGGTATAPTPVTWPLGRIDGTDEAKEALRLAGTVAEEGGLKALNSELEKLEADEEDLRRKYQLAQRRTLAYKVTAFKEKLKLFDSNALPVSAVTLKLLGLPSNKPGSAQREEPVDASASAAPVVTVPPRVVQVFALWEAWRTNGLPKNELKQYVKLEPPGLPDVWSFIQPFIVYTNNPNGKLKAEDIMTAIVTGKNPNAQGNNWGMAQASIPEFDWLDKAAYALELISLNLESMAHS